MEGDAPALPWTVDREGLRLAALAKLTTHDAAVDAGRRIVIVGCRSHTSAVRPGAAVADLSR